MPVIPMGRSRDVKHPYLTIRLGTWEWRVLKAYATDPDKPYARWLCAVKSPMTHPGYDIGDTYISDVVDAVVSGGGTIEQRDEAVPDEALPARLRLA